MKVAILAAFPLHLLPGFELNQPPRGHYATWLPPLALATSAPDGIERTWITLSENVTERREIACWNQTFLILPTRKKGRASTLFRADRALIAKTLREIKPDLVHGWGTEDVYALAAVTSEYPHVISMQGLLSHYIFHTRTDLRTLFQALQEFLILRRTRHLTCESEWAKPILRRRAPRAKITCVEYGVHPDFFVPAWQPDPERPAALFVGSLEVRKGLQDVLEAFRSGLDPGELWVAGSGSLEDKKGQPQVKWLGRLDRARLIEVMSKAWCLVLPTRADTSPNVVKEARVIGLPVITTRCGGQSDYIKDGKNGFIVEPGDVKLLTERLRSLLADHSFCVAKGNENWENDRAFFRVELTAEKFRQVYREVLERP
jgi:glycosyltransferase involved in cell wall biosynthesis